MPDETKPEVRAIERTDGSRKAVAVQVAEAGLNDALVILGNAHPQLRRALLDARGSIREAIGEARS